jgi:hypothetical protein
LFKKFIIYNLLKYHLHNYVDDILILVILIMYKKKYLKYKIKYAQLVKLIGGSSSAAAVASASSAADAASDAASSAASGGASSATSSKRTFQVGDDVVIIGDTDNIGTIINWTYDEKKNQYCYEIDYGSKVDNGLEYEVKKYKYQNEIQLVNIGDDEIFYSNNPSSKSEVASNTSSPLEIELELVSLPARKKP